MRAVSLTPAGVATPERLATRNSRLASVAGRVAERVDAVRRALVARAPKGFAAELASLMEWRVERRGREISGVEKLSLADVAAEIEIHLAYGRQDAVDEIVTALLDGIQSATVAITPGSLIRVFDDHGQLRLRFER
jgi:hypothetical protein